MSRTVSLAGLSFGAWPVTDAAGSRWTFSVIEGWDNGGAGVRRPASERPRAHGVFAERGWRGGRSVGIRGNVECPSRAAAASVVTALSALLADGTPGDLEVADADLPTMTARVGLASEPTVDWFQPTEVAFAFDLFAPDPLRYGEVAAATTTFPVRTGGLRFPLYSDGAGANVGALDYGDVSQTGRVLLTNPGTADSWPQFQVSGPVDAAGFELVRVGSGERLVFEDAVPAGSALVLDSATGTAVIDGVADRGGRLTWRDWTPVPAGGSAEFAFIPLGATSAAVLTATVRPAWW